MQKQARTLGADVRHNTRAVSLNIIADDEVSVVVETGGVQETITARSAVVTVGAWTQKFLGDKFRLPALTVTQVQPVHFREIDTTLDWPSFTHTRGSDATYDYWYKDIYGLLTPGVGVKVGWHGGGTVVDPDKRTDYVDRAELEALQRYVGEWIPGVDRDHFEQISCTYTSTETEDFVLDRVGPIVIGAGFSGQGFKFTPSVGTALAGLVTGERGVAEAFRINGHVARVPQRPGPR